MRISRQDDYSSLYELPTSVTTVQLYLIAVSADYQLPRLPEHVTTLILSRCAINVALHLGEGLQFLELKNVMIDVSIAQWTFPSTLRQIKLKTGRARLSRQLCAKLDFRAVSVPSMIIVGVADEVRNLPECLDQLTLEGLAKLGDQTVSFSEDTTSALVVLPPRLRRLSLINLDGVEPYASPESRVITDLFIKKVHKCVNVTNVFPGVESFHIESIYGRDYPIYSFDRIKSLTIKACVAYFSVTIDNPVLESLTIIDGAKSGCPLLVDHTEALGKCLVNLTLDHIGFPHSDEWQRLESVTIRHSNPGMTMPFIPHLQELVINQPLMTNGYAVRDLSEYKQAWGQSTRKKGVPMGYLASTL